MNKDIFSRSFLFLHSTKSAVSSSMASDANLQIYSGTKTRIQNSRTVETYAENIRTVKKRIDSFLTSLDEERLENVEDSEILEVTQWLKSELEKYENISRQFIAFFKGTHTVQVKNRLIDLFLHLSDQRLNIQFNSLVEWIVTESLNIKRK